MPDRLNDISSPRLSLGADQAGAFRDSTKGLTQVGGPADERHRKCPLVNMVGLVGGGKDLTFIDVIHPESLQDLGLSEVTDAGLCHDRDSRRLLDPLNHLRI